MDETCWWISFGVEKRGEISTSNLYILFEDENIHERKMRCSWIE